MRRKLLALWIFILFIFILFLPIKETETAKELYLYYTQNFKAETAGLNAVTSIYLDYRVFDTLFETLLLLVSVIGIFHFSRHTGDY